MRKSKEEERREERGANQTIITTFMHGMTFGCDDACANPLN